MIKPSQLVNMVPEIGFVRGACAGGAEPPRRERVRWSGHVSRGRPGKRNPTSTPGQTRRRDYYPWRGVVAPGDPRRNHRFRVPGVVASAAADPLDRRGFDMYWLRLPRDETTARQRRRVS